MTRGGNRCLTDQDTFPDDGEPQPPKGTTAAVRKVWKELLSQIPKGLLRQIDGHQIEILSTLIVQQKALAKVIAADPTDSKCGRLYLANAVHVARLSGMFALSPGDRRRLKLDRHAEEGQTAFAELLERMTA